MRWQQLQSANVASGPHWRRPVGGQAAGGITKKKTFAVRGSIFLCLIPLLALTRRSAVGGNGTKVIEKGQQTEMQSEIRLRYEDRLNARKRNPRRRLKINKRQKPGTALPPPRGCVLAWPLGAR